MLLSDIVFAQLHSFDTREPSSYYEERIIRVENNIIEVFQMQYDDNTKNSE